MAALTTRELAIYLMELRRASQLDPDLEGEVADACAALRDELLHREWPVDVTL
ncbi:MAG TPA: hypothetical protein VKU60_08795 [Chloroflexota bacterium]|nr:hypothetical protein [Chloroflexota bacterium]